MQAEYGIQEDLSYFLSIVRVVQGSEMGKLTEFINHHHDTISGTRRGQPINEIHTDNLS